MDMNNIRSRFPILANKTYLNSCSYGAMAASVRRAIEQYLDDRDTRGACWEEWVGNLEALRDMTAQLLGAQSEEIALVPSLSSGVNAFASCLDFAGERSKVVVTSHDFPTTAHIWHAQKRRAARVHRVELDDCVSSEEATARFVDAIDDTTALVSIPYICYRNGRRLDVRAIAKLARAHGALVLVDAYQAVGTFPVDVRDIDADVLVGGYLKYLMGTAGLAYMYVKGDLVEEMLPTATGWFAQEDVSAMTIAENLPARSARRFEGGTPNVSGINACRAGLDIMQEVGIDAIEQQNIAITDAIKREAAARGWVSATGDWPHGAMIALRSTDMMA
ncbi:MAG: aminotransferase class V-fold PLP-dependent enzyme, partial [Chromatocurvus sp.]